MDGIFSQFQPHQIHKSIAKLIWSIYIEFAVGEMHTEFSDNIFMHKIKLNNQLVSFEQCNIQEQWANFSIAVFAIDA